MAELLQTGERFKDQQGKYSESLNLSLIRKSTVRWWRKESTISMREIYSR